MHCNEIVSDSGGWRNYNFSALPEQVGNCSTLLFCFCSKAYPKQSG